MSPVVCAQSYPARPVRYIVPSLPGGGSPQILWSGNHVLVLDAFSGDSIPTHLLTREAVPGRRWLGAALAFWQRLDGPADADMARRHTEVFLELLLGKGFAKPNPSPMFPNPSGLLRLEPYSEGLRERIWWGAGTNATSEWAAKIGMNLQSSTLKIDESGKPFHVQQAEQIRLYRAAWKEAGHTRTPRVSVSRSIFALVDDRDRMYFGRGGKEGDSCMFVPLNTQASVMDMLRGVVIDSGPTTSPTRLPSHGTSTAA